MKTKSCNFSKTHPLVGWQKQRVAILKALFTRLAEDQKNGNSANKALDRAARRWKSGHYRDGRKVRFSKATLKRLFYAWKAKGKTPAALALNYKSGRAKPPTVAEHQQFLHATLHAMTMRAAFRQSGLSFKLGWYFRNAPRAIRQQARLTLKANRDHRSAHRRHAAFCAELDRRGA